jgi:ATP-dependent Clp protease protease subunit
MSKTLRLPMSHQQVKPKLRWETPAASLERWNPALVSAAAEDTATTINIYSTIGEYGDGSGMTPKIVSSILRKADGGDVVVNINSPGGDFFDGLAIHTLLKEYKGDVQVNIIGMAASAASVVALAGTEINIAKAAFFMIHNAWSIAVGNRHDMMQVADMLQQFDDSMVSLYSEATGMDKRLVAKLMDAETWIVGADAVEQGFATALLGDENVKVEEALKNDYSPSMRKIDVALAKAGMPRSERRNLIKELTSTPCAAGGTEATPCAGNEDWVNALSAIHQTINQVTA